MATRRAIDKLAFAISTLDGSHYDSAPPLPPPPVCVNFPLVASRQPTPPAATDADDDDEKEEDRTLSTTPAGIQE